MNVTSPATLASVDYGPSLTSHEQTVSHTRVRSTHLAAIYLVFDARIISLRRWREYHCHSGFAKFRTQCLGMRHILTVP